MPYTIIKRQDFKKVGWTLVVGFLVLEPTLHMISLFSNDLAHFFDLIWLLGLSPSLLGGRHSKAAVAEEHPGSGHQTCLDKI